MSLFPCRATPYATEVLKKFKTCSRWFHSQIIAVPQMTHDIFFINKCSSLYQNNSDHSGASCLFKSSRPKMLCKKGVLEIFVKLTGKNLCRIFYFCRPQTCNVIKKETTSQVFSCQFFKIFKSAFFCRTPPVAASSNFKASGFTEAVMQMSF